MSNSRIVQLVSCERGWHVAWMEGDLRLYSEVACWALMSDGATLAMIDEDGNGLMPQIGQLLSPHQSWTYETMRGLDKPDDADWEFVSQVADGSGDIFTTWRDKPRDIRLPLRGGDNK